MQHKTHTDHPSKNKDQQNQNQNTGNQKATTENGKDKNGMQHQNKPGNANNNQQGDRSQSKG